MSSDRRIEVKESQGKVLQLCHSSGKVKVDKTRITDKGIVAEGIVALKILYIIGNDEMPFYSMDAMLPFTHLIEQKRSGRNAHIYFRLTLNSFLLQWQTGMRLKSRRRWTECACVQTVGRAAY